MSIDLPRPCTHPVTARGEDGQHHCVLCGHLFLPVPLSQPKPDDEHVILLAVQTTGCASFREAQRLILDTIEVGLDPDHERPFVESYWIAEDDRIDGSDCESAVFCKPGEQGQAMVVLSEHGLTGEPDYTTWSPRAQAQRWRHD
jgi:hypothetical protein